MNCARGRRGNGTCLKPKDIISIARRNKYIGGDLPGLKKHLKCKDDECLIQYSENPSLLDMMRLLPKGPDKVNGWLSNTDINNILKRYAPTKKKYVHLGTVPVDFETVSNKNWHVSVADVIRSVQSGYQRLSMVINMDPSWKSGSHWVALYISVPDRSIEYFNSTGRLPPKPVDTFMKSLLKVLPNKFSIKINRVQHQFADTECGMYSVIYIIKRLNGKSFDAITRRVILDDTINKCRSVYFRNYKNKVAITKGICS